MKHNQVRQVLFPILAAFIWGTAFVAQDLCADAIGAFTFNAARYFIAVLALLVVILISDKMKKDKPVLSPAEKKAANKQLWIGGLCCGAALAIASNFQQAGLVAGTDAGKAGFITALYVVLVPVFGLFFKRKVNLPTWIAVMLSVVALYLLCIKGSFTLAPGDLLILVCAVCFAVHILVIDHFTATVDGVKLSCLQFLFACIISSVCMLIFEDVDMAAILSCVMPLLYVGIFSCGVKDGEGHIERTRADHMGMLATAMNCMAMADVLEQKGVDVRVQTALEIRAVAEPYIRARAIRHLEKGRVVIFGCGIGCPFFSTDTAAVLRAAEIEADVILLAKNIDGVYDSDPAKNADAVKFDTITYDEVLKRHLAVMDSTATSLSMDNHIPVLVFALKDPENIIRALRGEKIGTIVKED